MQQLLTRHCESKDACKETNVSNRKRQKLSVRSFFKLLLVNKCQYLSYLVSTCHLFIISEDIQLQDLEDCLRMRNQWLIRTPRKSFYVAAESYEEKQAWIEHIEDCQNRLLQSGRRTPTSIFAITWIPDQASAICMRCSDRFTMTQRRHHCRKCGFVVCGACSKKQALIRHIHPTKRLRVCDICHPNLLKAEAQEINRLRGDSTGKSGSEEDLEEFSDQEDQVENHDTSRWMNCEMGSWSTYVYLKPEHVRP